MVVHTVLTEQNVSEAWTPGGNNEELPSAPAPVWILVDVV